MIILKELKLYNCYIQLFEVPIYKSKICFISFTSIKGYYKAIEFLNKLNFNTEIIKDPDYAKAYGFVLKDDYKDGTLQTIFINKGKKYIKEYTDTLNHEGMHLIQNICEHHGLEHIKGKNNEHIAYLTGYIMDYLARL